MFTIVVNGEQLSRRSNGKSVWFRDVEVDGARLPLTLAADGRFSGDRRAARAALVRVVEGTEQDLGEEELRARDRPGLLAAFVRGE